MEVTYNKCHAIGRPGDVDLVITISTPLRLEFHDCNTLRNLRVNWEAPFGIARDTFSSLVQLTKRIEIIMSNVVSYCLASKPVTDANRDIQVIESAQAITYKTGVNGVKPERSKSLPCVRTLNSDDKVRLNGRPPTNHLHSSP